jgi:hypothetical protein
VAGLRCHTLATVQAPLIAIVSSQCLNLVQIDFIDYSTTPDGNYNWVVQIKDHFSCFIWLEALKDKTALSVANIFSQWIGRNGKPRKV